MSFLTKIFLIFTFIIFEPFFIADRQFDKMKLNEVQVIGSHNSYKQAIDPSLFSYLSKTDSASLSKIEYSHISISQQLDLGLLNLEIDVYADPSGGNTVIP